MDLLERAVYFTVGGGVGFILGFIVARLREIKEELDDVDQCVKKCSLDHEHLPRRGRFLDERGSMRIPGLTNLMFLLVLTIVVWGAFSAQKASNDVHRTQQDLKKVTSCNQIYLAETIAALNERTTYTQEQAARNVTLQEAQAELLAVLLQEPPPTDATVRAALASYSQALASFVDVSEKTRSKVMNNPYPTTAGYEACLEQN